MRAGIPLTAAMLLVVLVAFPAKGEEPAPTPAAPSEHLDARAEEGFFLAYWNQGVRFRIFSPAPLVQERKRIFSLFKRRELVRGRIGLKLAVDAALYKGSGRLRDIGDEIDIRRSFFFVDGNFHFLRPAAFKVEFGFITQKVFLDSAHLRFDEIPYLGSLKIGQFDAPVSLEALESSRDRTFMEKASPVQAFSPGSRAGIQLSDQFSQDRATWAVGWFADGADVEIGDASSSFARLIGRLTWLPYAEEEGLLHLGVSGSYLFSSDDGIRYQSRPESYLAPTVVDTGDIDSGSALVVGLEHAVAHGPFSVQAESLHAFVPEDNYYFYGLYLYASAFLTEESRPYDRRSAVFSQVLPRSDFSIRKRRFGAWEWAGRFSYLDLSDGDVDGGRMLVLTTGYNWYWNRYVRWQFEYSFANVDGGKDDGDLHTFQMRFQLVI